MPGPLSAYLQPTHYNDDETPQVPKDSRWMVRHMAMEGGAITMTPYILYFRDHFTTATAYDALMVRLKLIDPDLTNLSRHSKGLWRVFDLKRFEATDFRVFVAPPVDVPDVLHIKQVD